MPKFKRYALNVWNVDPTGKTDEEIALAGLDAMADYMREIGVVMNLTELGVTPDMIEGIADATFILKGGYKVLTRDEVVAVLKASL